jgi:hypothetical protein
MDALAGSPTATASARLAYARRRNRRSDLAEQFPDTFDRRLYRPAFPEDLKQLLSAAPKLPNA